MQKYHVNRTRQFTTILSILKEVLVDGLPVPPLMEIITGYAIDQPHVSTWFTDEKNDPLRGHKNFNPVSIAIMTTQPLTFLVCSGVDICLCESENGKVSLFAANNESYDKFFPRDILVDPKNSNRVFIAEASSILLIENGVPSTIVGHDEFRGNREGAGLTARLNCPTGMALTADGQTLIFCDTSNNLIREVDLRSRQTGRICDGFDQPRNCIWNRLTIEPQSELFITTKTEIQRLNVKTRQLTTLKIDKKFNAWGFKQTSSGLLIVPCASSKCIYSVDPSNGSVVRLAGSGLHGGTNGGPLSGAEFKSPSDCVVVESESCIAVVETDTQSIRKVYLPFFQF